LIPTFCTASLPPKPRLIASLIQFRKVMNAQSRVNIDFSLNAKPLRWEDTLPAV
jgi:hypothetical protein